MANLKEVKGRIQSVTSTQQITKAMKMVAAAKLRRAQDRIEQMRPYSKKLTAIIQNVAGGVDSEQVDSPYSEVRGEEKILLIVVSSDRGLCGAFNSSVFKQAKSVIANKYATQNAAGNVTILTIGKKANDHFSKRGFNVISDFHELLGNLDFPSAMEAAEMAMNGFVEGEYDKVEIIYNEFKNVAMQIVRDEQFLPLQSIASEEENKEVSSSSDYIYEPNQEFIFSQVIPKSLKVQFYKALLESNASEQGARMTAMDQATENAGELLKELRLTYNRTRQAAITKEILEIVGGAEALSKGG